MSEGWRREGAAGTAQRLSERLAAQHVRPLAPARPPFPPAHDL